MMSMIGPDLLSAVHGCSSADCGLAGEGLPRPERGGLPRPGEASQVSNHRSPPPPRGTGVNRYARAQVQLRFGQHLVTRFLL